MSNSPLQSEQQDPLSFRAEQRTAPVRPTKPVSKKLTQCPACEGMVSRKAHFCPHCGEPNPANHLRKSQVVSCAVWTAIIAAGCWFAYSTLWPLVLQRLG
ncbi:hypothetical protein Q8W15_05590 [Photobacterium damselae subsp. piscicida]|nr:hypothetical protein [Photobacterium damselae subsp. piscicida]